jgi:hypothetical protein
MLITDTVLNTSKDLDPIRLNKLTHQELSKSVKPKNRNLSTKWKKLLGPHNRQLTTLMLFKTKSR